MAFATQQRNDFPLRIKSKAIKPQRQLLAGSRLRQQPLCPITGIHIQRQQSLRHTVYAQVQPLLGEHRKFQPFVICAGDRLVIAHRRLTPVFSNGVHALATEAP